MVETSPKQPPLSTTRTLDTRPYKCCAERMKKRYGTVRLTKELKQQNIRISERTVARIMKENGLRSCMVKKYKATMNSKHDFPVYQNKLDCQFKATKLNEKWVTDIKYIRTREGWLYLATVMDLYSRRIVGWQIGDRITKELCLHSLRQAFRRRKPGKELLHHSDCGSQYSSHDYQDLMKLYRMTGSMNRKCNCYYNACIESFLTSLKKELVYMNDYQTREEAKSSIFEYI